MGTSNFIARDGGVARFTSWKLQHLRSFALQIFRSRQYAINSIILLPILLTPFAVWTWNDRAESLPGGLGGYGGSDVPSSKVSRLTCLTLVTLVTLVTLITLTLCVRSEKCLHLDPQLDNLKLKQWPTLVWVSRVRVCHGYQVCCVARQNMSNVTLLTCVV